MDVNSFAWCWLQYEDVYLFYFLKEVFLFKKFFCVFLQMLCDCLYKTKSGEGPMKKRFVLDIRYVLNMIYKQLRKVLTQINESDALQNM